MIVSQFPGVAIGFNGQARIVISVTETIGGQVEF